MYSNREMTESEKIFTYYASLLDNRYDDKPKLKDRHKRLYNKLYTWFFKGE